MFTASQDDPKHVVGDWAGTLSLPTGDAYRIIFHISEENEKLKATLDSPDQNAFGLKMDKVVFKEGKIEMTINLIQGNYKGTLKDGKIDGSWTQGPQSFPLNLEKVEPSDKN